MGLPTLVKWVGKIPSLNYHSRSGKWWITSQNLVFYYDLLPTVTGQHGRWLSDWNGRILNIALLPLFARYLSNAFVGLDEHCESLVLLTTLPMLLSNMCTHIVHSDVYKSNRTEKLHMQGDFLSQWRCIQIVQLQFGASLVRCDRGGERNQRSLPVGVVTKELSVPWLQHPFPPSWIPLKFDVWIVHASPVRRWSFCYPIKILQLVMFASRLNHIAFRCQY